MKQMQLKPSNNSKFMIICLLILLLTGCSNSNRKNVNYDQPYLSKSSFLLDTIVNITIYDKQEEELIEDCFDLIKRYELIYSRTALESELYALNSRSLSKSGTGYTVSDELAELIGYGLYYSELSEGSFDISIAPITSLWSFKGSNPVKPSEEDVSNALHDVNYSFITLKGNEVTFDNDNVQMDFGAIAKGYIADKVKEYLVSKGVGSAMINLGGNVLTIGSKPDGTPFKVGIQMPYADRNETIAVMEINDLSVVSSGIYERFFILDGVSYHHILDPKTGYPYDNELISVSIISKQSVDGDGLSTTCFALGLEEGLNLIESIPDTYAIFITSDYKLHYSKGFEDAIKVID